MPGLSGFSSGRVSTCSGTSLQPTRGISSQWLTAVRARCSSVCFFRPEIWTQCAVGNTNIQQDRSWVTIFILDLRWSQEDSICHLYSSTWSIMWSVDLPFLAKLRQDLTGFHRVPPNVVSMAEIKGKKCNFNENLPAQPGVLILCGAIVTSKACKMMLTASRRRKRHRWLCICCRSDFPSRSLSRRSDRRCPPGPSRTLTPLAWTPWGRWPQCRTTWKRSNVWLGFPKRCSDHGKSPLCSYFPNTGFSCFEM